MNTTPTLAAPLWSTTTLQAHAQPRCHYKRTLPLMLALALVLIFCRVSAAETIVAPGANWLSFPSSLNQDGSPYWDNPSFDGHQKGVGYFISGYDGAYPGEALHLQPEFLGQPGGTAPGDFYFLNSGPMVLSMLMLEVSAFANLNEVGWYDINHPGSLFPIFTGSAIVGDSTTFSPSAAYGLYIRTGHGHIFRTQSSLNTGYNQGNQQFAVFRHNGNYIIGVEDLPYWKTGMEGSGDFNDVVFSLIPTVPSSPNLGEVPEPSSFALIGGGLILGISWLRRIQRRRSDR